MYNYTFYTCHDSFSDRDIIGLTPFLKRPRKRRNGYVVFKYGMWSVDPDQLEKKDVSIEGRCFSSRLMSPFHSRL
jgi:hypothetical protein